MFFQVNICFGWLKALAAYGVAWQTECPPTDKPQGTSPLSTVWRTKQTSPQKELQTPLDREWGGGLQGGAGGGHQPCGSADRSVPRRGALWEKRGT